MIQVTQPFLPPKQEYDELLQSIWERNWLTNNGPLVNELEDKLRKFLKVENLLFVTNGTIAIQLAIKALGLRGKIITTPFSYVATTSSIVWEGCEPIFVDIDPVTCNLDPDKIERAITPDTCAILATHVYGIPCDVESINKIATRHNLKVIYDGAHAFGVEVHGQSVFNFGDVSTCSLHATKLYHSVEGGLVIARDSGLLKKIDFHRNFGHNGPGVFATLGINGKNSEFHAAMGLVNLKYVPRIISERRELCEHYDKQLQHVKAVKPKAKEALKYNYAYYPLVFESEAQLLKIIEQLNSKEIYPRRYFHPTLEELPYVGRDSGCDIAQSIASRVICLPLYNGLSKSVIDRICEIIINAQN